MIVLDTERGNHRPEQCSGVGRSPLPGAVRRL